MKRLGLFIFCTMMTLGSVGQTERNGLHGEVKDSLCVADSSVVVFLPMVEKHPMLFTSWSPLSFGGTFWDIHEGLNAQVDAGVTVGWGKHNPFRGGSFFTDVSLLYAKPLTDCWTVAVGGTLSRFRFFDNYVTTASVQALANYQFNEHLSGTVYGMYHHPLNSDKGFRPSPLFYQHCATVGAELNYRFNNNVTLGIGFHETFYGDPPARPGMYQKKK